MSATAFCGTCGEQIGADARFCPSCGDNQDAFQTAAGQPAVNQAPQSPEPSTQPLPSPGVTGGPVPHTGPSPAPDGAADASRGDSRRGSAGGRAEQFVQRVDALEPGAGAFAGQLAAGFQTPGVLAALIGAAVGALGCFGVGLVLAIALPDESFIGSIGETVGLLTEAFAQTVGLLLVKFGSPGERVAPMLFILVPIAACAAGAFSQAGKLRGLAPRWWLLSGAAVGLPFGLLMLVAAVATGDVEASAGGAFVLGVIWGAAGGVLGVSMAIRRDAPAVADGPVSSRVRLVGRLLTATLKPLAALVVVAALIGTAAWWIGSFRDHETARLDRSLPVALVENTLYAGEHGLNYAALGAGTQFTTDGVALPPVPVNSSGDIRSEFRLFDLSNDMEAYFFVPLLIVLIALPLLLALYAGFCAARAAEARRPEQAAAWGALVGPVWAISLALLNAMHVKLLGQPDGDSLFGIFLLAGAALGAIGGLLSSQATTAGSEGSVQNG